MFLIDLRVHDFSPKPFSSKITSLWRLAERRCLGRRFCGLFLEYWLLGLCAVPVEE